MGVLSRLSRCHALWRRFRGVLSRLSRTFQDRNNITDMEHTILCLFYAFLEMLRSINPANLFDMRLELFFHHERLRNFYFIPTENAVIELYHGKTKEERTCSETTNPDLLSEWDYEMNSIQPDEITYGHNKKVWWKCKTGHSWQAAPYTRAKGIGCPYCGRKKTLKGYNDLLSSCFF